MSEFQVSKVILLSHKETTSAEYSFAPGLNLVLGRNDTGKSSLVKSIFYTFGCSVKLEPSWKRMVDTFIVVWRFRGTPYTLMRRLNAYFLYQGDAGRDLGQVKFIGRYHRATSELAAAIVGDILGVDLTWVSKDRDELPPSLSHLFSFSYIDQDSGWTKVAESFSNLNYIPDWKKTLIKYVVGYQDNEFFELIKLIKTVQSELDAKELQRSHISGFIADLAREIEQRHGVRALDPRTLSLNVSQGAEELSSITVLERKLLQLNEELRDYRAEHYNLNRQLSSVLELQRQLESDHQFAMESAAELTCPFCGTVHKNDLRHRSEILKDIDDASKLAADLRSSIKENEARSRELQELIRVHKLQLLRLKKSFQNRKEHAGLYQEYKVEGKLELLNESRGRIKALQDEVEKLVLEKYRLEKEKKALESRKRRKAISDSLSGIYNELLLKVGHAAVELKDFLPQLKSSGSKLPRAVFAYYVALFIYNRDRSHFPIRWLVVDTPNQQGQDDENLRGIYSLFHEFASRSEQVIVASERATGHEDHAHVILLEEPRKVLGEALFKYHRDIADGLLELSNTHPSN